MLSLAEIAHVNGSGGGGRGVSKFQLIDALEELWKRYRLDSMDHLQILNPQINMNNTPTDLHVESVSKCYDCSF